MKKYYKNIELIMEKIDDDDFFAIYNDQVFLFNKLASDIYYMCIGVTLEEIINQIEHNFKSDLSKEEKTSIEQILLDFIQCEIIFFE